MKPLDSDKKVSKELSAPAEATQTAPVVEEKIDFYWQESPKIDRFVLPGGTVTAANLHLCRCFAREAERNAVALLEYNEAINEEALKFLNRLSDYFFALARWVNGQAKQTEILYENSAPVFDRKK